MKYGYSICFRPFGGFQRAWFIRHWTFDTNEERLNFVCNLPRWKKKYPFDCGLYVIPEREEKK